MASNYWDSDEEEEYTGEYYTGTEETASSTGTSANLSTSGSSIYGIAGATRGITSTSGSSGTSSPTGSVSVSKTVYEGDAPTLGELPTYTAPSEWSGEKMAGETQKKAALGLREARQSLRETTAGLGNDPASRLAMKTALAQHGINIQSAITSAQSSAETSEANELARKTSEAQIQYQAQLNYMYQTYQNAWNKYISTGKTISGTQGTYGTSSSTSSYWNTVGVNINDLIDSVGD